MANNLLPIQKQNELIAQLPIASQKYIVAKNGHKVTDLKIGTAIKGIYDVVVQTMINSGNKKDLEDIDLITNLAESTYQLITTKNQFLTIEEFKILCFNGVTNEYGDYYGINLSTISNWIKSFQNDNNRKQSMHYWNNLIHLATIKDKTEQQKRQIIIDGLITLFNELKPKFNEYQDKFKLEMPIISHIFYDFLKELGLINFTAERKEQIYDRSKYQYEAKLQKSKLDPSIKFNQKDLESALLNLPKDRTFSNLCKLEALRDYLSDLFELDEDINSIISEKL
jgi:hypothetical protein